MSGKLATLRATDDGNSGRILLIAGAFAAGCLAGFWIMGPALLG